MNVFSTLFSEKLLAMFNILTNDVGMSINFKYLHFVTFPHTDR